jgi:DNA-binding SARP family transcriptional activator
VSADPRFRVLGDVEALVDGRRVDAGHARQQCVLAVLLVEAGRTVSVDQLLERAWGTAEPLRARNALSGYVSRLRRALAVRISRRADGYRLEVDPDSVDLHRFERLVARARRGDDPESALALLEQALALWTGDAFASLDTPWLNDRREGLAAQRLTAMLDRFDLVLAQGRHAELLGELSVTAAAHPLDERLAGQLMLALYRCGRQAGALHQYERMRLRLAEELGADPSPALSRLHQRILVADPMLTSVGSPITTATRAPTPRQLPAPPRLFTGRVRELAALDGMLAAADSVAICAVSGTAGVGKTALALHWAHRVADRFPDGQLYANLRGFDAGAATGSAVAVRSFLDALGVPPHEVPTGLDAQAGLLRSLLAGRRVLVLLDNAADVEQVRPLLPGTPGCLALVTSRHHLHGLVAAEGAHPLTLDLMPPADARHLIADRIGAHRVAAEPEAVEEIVARCARLPLALAVVAAYAVARPDARLRDVAARLVDGLDALDGGDASTDVRAVLSWSYRALRPDAARLFRLLGLHPGPDFAAPAAASLAGDAPAPLPELVRASLVQEHAAGRYVMHDLLRAYAGELVRAEPEASRRAATRRLLDHYVRTAHAAAMAIHPHRHPLALPPPPGADVDDPVAWFASERTVLLPLVDHAAREGFDVHAWQLAWALTDVLDRLGHWPDLAAVQHLALAAAGRTGDGVAQAHAHRALARAEVQLGHGVAAEAHYRQALGLFAAHGDRAGQAHTHLGLGWLLERTGRGAAATEHNRRGLHLFRALGHKLGQARALNHLGTQRALAEDHDGALADCAEALELFQEIDDRFGQAATHDSLGAIHQRTGRYTDAIVHYRHAVDLLRAIGDRYYEAQVLIHLGDAHRDAAFLDLAQGAWRDALRILVDLGHPDAGQVADRLSTAATDPQPAPADSR